MLSNIYIDLDGVLADFYGEARRILGADYQAIPPASAWAKLQEIDCFFQTLPLLPDALELWEGLQGKGALHILTAMPKPTGKLGTVPGDKRAWVRKHICARVPVLLVPHGVLKARYAAPGSILIDDLPRNVLAWQEAGGLGIVHTNTKSTLAVLAEKLTASRL